MNLRYLQNYNTLCIFKGGKYIWQGYVIFYLGNLQGHNPFLQSHVTLLVKQKQNKKTCIIIKSKKVNVIGIQNIKNWKINKSV